MSIGVDVGGTKCLGVLWSGSDVVAEVRRPTPVGAPTGSDGVLATIVSVVADLEAQAGDQTAPLPVGVGVPGLVTRDGVLRASPNLAAVADLRVGDILQERLERSVSVDNDATCAAIAEWRQGQGVGIDDLVVVTLGTGIGGGIICNGAVVRGSHGFAGEIGHMVVDPSGPQCPCGQRGCWERLASGSALQARADDVFGAGRMRGEDLALLAADGDQKARSIFIEFAHWVALGLANITNFLDPAVIVIGGGVARTAPLFLADVRQSFAAMLYAPNLRPQPRIEVAAWDERAGAVGAAHLPFLSDGGNSVNRHSSPTRSK